MTKTAKTKTFAERNQEIIELRGEITTIEENLAIARADIAILQRLKDAEANAKQWASDLETAKAKLAQAEADEVEARRQQRFASIRNMEVISSTATGLSTAGTNDGVIHAQYRVTYEEQAYNCELRRTLWRRNSAAGIHVLRPDLLEYLIEKQPGVIPAAIMDLSPGDPANAIAIYCTAKRRGFLSGPTAQ